MISKKMRILLLTTIAVTHNAFSAATTTPTGLILPTLPTLNTGGTDTTTTPTPALITSSSATSTTTTPTISTTTTPTISTTTPGLIITGSTTSSTTTTPTTSTTTPTTSTTTPTTSVVTPSISTTTTDSSKTTESMLVADLSSKEINLNAPVITITVGGSYSFKAPEGTTIFPLQENIDEKKALDHADSTAIRSEIIEKNRQLAPWMTVNGKTHDTRVIKITGVRESTEIEEPYPVLVKTNSTNYVTIAKVRVSNKTFSK